MPPSLSGALPFSAMMASMCFGSAEMVSNTEYSSSVLDGRDRLTAAPAFLPYIESQVPKDVFALSTSRALCLMRLIVPRLDGELMFPGTAKSFLSCLSV
jgi:hypothetical protein